MKFLDYKTIALIILAAAFALYVLFDKDPEPNAEKINTLETALAIADQEIISLRSDSAKLSQKVVKDSARQANERIVHKAEVKKLVSTVAKYKANPIVKKVRMETLEIDSLLTAMEKKDSLQTARIDTLESNLAGLRVDMKAVNKNCGDLLQVERERFAAQEALTQEYRNQVRKERRANRWLKVGAISLGVLGLFGGSQL